MKLSFGSTVFALASVISLSRGVIAAPVIGQPAPDFNVQDTQGRSQHLADQKGKYVVLEWFNFGCPFCRKHYATGNIPKLQQTYVAKNVVWYSILSSAPGKEGFANAAQANQQIKDHKGTPTAILLDPQGTIGHLYDAKTTPHMFVIDPKGVLIYEGAIDSTESTDPADIPKSVNYVSQALDQAMAGKPVSTPATRAYGCSIKY